MTSLDSKRDADASFDARDLDCAAVSREVSARLGGVVDTDGSRPWEEIETTVLNTAIPCFAQFEDPAGALR